MDDYGAATYGDRIAGVYDDLYGTMFDTDSTVSLLAELSGRGPALELGIGTGRVALPLTARGVDVRGIDSSHAMVSKLRAKAGGRDIPVEIGDFADVDVDGRFTLIFIVFNTFFGLLTQEDQVRCFANVARHLSDDGVFVVEAFVPDPTRFDRHQRVEATRVSLDDAELEVSRHDPVRQRVDSLHLVVSEQGTRIYPVRIRYAWPSELDLMARSAGLRLAERWGGWRKEPFTSESTTHVSIYARAG